MPALRRLASRTWGEATRKARSDRLSLRSLIVMAALIPACGGCAVVAVADAAVSVAATAVKAGAKVVGAAVDAVIPEKSPSDKK